MRLNNLTHMPEYRLTTGSNNVSPPISISIRGPKGSSVSTYRRRYPDFPAPVVDMGAGRCLLWLRADVEAWAKGRQ